MTRGGGRDSYGNYYEDDYFDTDPYYDRRNNPDSYPPDDEMDVWDDPQSEFRRRRNTDAVKKRREKSFQSSGAVNLIMQGNKKWGVTLLAVSLLLTGFGISLFFNAFFIRLGNIALVAGVSLLIGPGRCAKYFTQPSKLRGTIIFSIGFFLIFVGRSILGLACEVFGFVNLFGNMLPIFMVMARSLPLVNELQSAPKRQEKRRPPPPPPAKKPMQDDLFPDDDGTDPYRRPTRYRHDIDDRYQYE